jgi:hypothetical protein
MAVALAACGGDGMSNPAGADGSTPMSPSGSGACPLTLTADGATYTAVTCDVKGMPILVPGPYKILIFATFNKASAENGGKIRSAMFAINDTDDATAPHTGTFRVGDAVPGASGNYSVTQFDTWSTLAGAMTVGSGSFTITEYDRAAKKISGTYDMVVKQGAMSKTITGALTHLPMSRAD